MTLVATSVPTCCRMIFMSVKITCKEIIKEANYIFWDRDSYFIDFDNYWSRLTGLIAQTIAEKTTNNWDNFNLIRTKAIKTLGINPESGKVASSSPLKIIPVNVFPSILACGLNEQVSGKTQDELHELFQSIVIASAQQCREFIKGSIIKNNLDIIKQINNKAKQILVTNDDPENNNIFLRESELKNYLHNILTLTNKEQLHESLNKESVLITENMFLVKAYLSKGIMNVLHTEDLKLLSFEDTSEKDLIVVNIDGASRGNPGPASIGIIFQKDNKILKEVSEHIGNQTNNFAEYTALIRALEISLENSYKNLEIRSDSELVVNQLNKIYKVKDVDIKNLFDRVSELSKELNNFKIIHVPREENLRADKLANQALNKLV